jgi:hypothetical protein
MARPRAKCRAAPSLAVLVKRNNDAEDNEQP